VFFKKLRNALIVWLALLVFLAFFSSLTHPWRDYSRVEGTVIDGFLPIFSFFNSLKTGVESVWTHYIFLTDVQRENDQLKKQLTQLKAENIQRNRFGPRATQKNLAT
jgi:cell shape-determining protein MreC